MLEIKQMSMAKVKFLSSLGVLTVNLLRVLGPDLRSFVIVSSCMGLLMNGYREALKPCTDQ